MINWDDFEKIWARTSPLTPYQFSDSNYEQGWNFVGATPPSRQMWDYIQKQNDEKFKYLRDNFGTPNMVTSSSQMTDTDKVYVYIGSEAGWNNGHWYYYDEGTSSWADGGVYNSVAFVTDTTLSIAGQPADAKATGDALALKSDLAGCTFTGNVGINADLSVTGDATIGTDLSVTGVSTLTGNVSAGADVTVVGDVSSANLTTSADATIGGDLSVTGDSTLADASVSDLVVNNDLSVAGDSSLTNLSVSGTTALAGTSTAPTPSTNDNSTKIATTAYVQSEIKPIEADVTINDKRISNIEKLLQGNLYDYQTDTNSAYTKTVPSGAMPYAGLEKVGGKTVVWNQLLREVSSTYWKIYNASYVSVTYGDGVAEVTILNTGGTDYLHGFLLKSSYAYTAIGGHKYFVSADVKTNQASVIYNGEYTAGIPQRLGTVANANTWTRIAQTFICETTTNKIFLTYPITNLEGLVYSIKNVMLIDLTLMFGAGNEPSTVAEVEAMFPAYYEYNEGTLLSAGVTEVESVGVNLFDPNAITDNKYLSTTTGLVEPNNSYCVTDYIPVNAGQTIYIPDTYTARRWLYDVDKNPIEYLNNSNEQYYVPTRSGYIRVSINKISVDINGVIIAYSTTIPTYVPYNGHTYPIPAEIQALEGYGWSAGTAFNYIDYERKKFVKCVDRVDLGTLPYSYVAVGTNLARFFVSAANVAIYMPNHKNPATNNDIWNAVTHNYVTVSYSSFVANQATNDKIAFGYTTDEIGFKDTSYTDATAFKSAMNGVYLYYELETPQEIDISQYLTDDNLISVESGGSLTFPNSNGTDYQIPVPSAETYMVDLQSALGE